MISNADNNEKGISFAGGFCMVQSNKTNNGQCYGNDRSDVVAWFCKDSSYNSERGELCRALRIYVHPQDTNSFKNNGWFRLSSKFDTDRVAHKESPANEPAHLYMKFGYNTSPTVDNYDHFMFEQDYVRCARMQIPYAICNNSTICDKNPFEISDCNNEKKIDYCKKNIPNPNCRTFIGLRENFGKFDEAMGTYCKIEANKEDSLCTCLNIPQTRLNYNPKCVLQKCLNSGYQTNGIVNGTCPSVIDCSVIFDVNRVGGNAEFTRNVINQRCGQNTNVFSNDNVIYAIVALVIFIICIILLCLSSIALYTQIKN